MLKVSFSISTKTGVAPTSEITSVVAKKEKFVVNTASPGPISFAINEICKASVPEAQVIHSLTPTYWANLFSRVKTFSPNIKSPFSKVLRIFLSKFFLI